MGIVFKVPLKSMAEPRMYIVFRSDYQLEWDDTEQERTVLELTVEQAEELHGFLEECGFGC